MKKNLIFKLIIDLFMVIVFIVLMDTAITGIDLHEYLGLFIFGIVAVHLILNWKWIKSVLKNLSSANINDKTKNMFLINVLLLIHILVIAVTGILISKSVFTFIFIPNTEVFKNIHVLASYSLAFLGFVHLLLHFKYLKNIFQQKTNKIWATVSGVIIATVGIYSLTINLYTKNKDNNIYIQSNVSSTSSTSTKKEEENETTTNASYSTDTTEVISLNDYLSKLVCTGCNKRCSLLAPQCSRGEAQAEVATETYYSSVNTSNE